jgi:hypothetical protein
LIVRAISIDTIANFSDIAAVGLWTTNLAADAFIRWAISTITCAIFSRVADTISSAADSVAALELISRAQSRITIAGLSNIARSIAGTADSSVAHIIIRWARE